MYLFIFLQLTRNRKILYTIKLTSQKYNASSSQLPTFPIICAAVAHPNEGTINLRIKNGVH